MIRTYDLIYNSTTQMKIHSRVWKEPPVGMLKANIRKVTKDKETGWLTVIIVATVADGTRTVMRKDHDDGDYHPVEVKKYKKVTAEKVIKAKGVNKRKITLRLVDIES